MLAVLLYQPLLLDGAVDGEREVLQVQRFREMVVRSQPHGLERAVELRRSCDHDHGNTGPVLAYRAEEPDAVHPRHVDVGENAVVGDRFEHRQGGLGVCRLFAGVPVRRQAPADDLANVCLVIDDEDLRDRLAHPPSTVRNPERPGARAPRPARGCSRGHSSKFHTSVRKRRHGQRVPDWLYYAALANGIQRKEGGSGERKLQAPGRRLTAP